MRFLILLLLPWMAAAQLNDAGYLNKLSHALRGQGPSLQEYKELKAAQADGQVDSFFEGKRIQYLSTSLHAEKVREYVSELLKLQPSKDLRYSTLDGFRASEFISRDNATDQFILKLIRQNRPWDELLTGGDYLIQIMDDEESLDIIGLSLPDREFYWNLLSPDVRDQLMAAKRNSQVPISFAQDDGRVAGILTTPRFFRRYATTALNKNRRRAAAIFRNFLCDNMIAAVPDPASNKGLIESIQFPKGAEPSFTEEEIHKAAQMQDDMHGSLADCKSCHYKLDPMGKVFVGSQVRLSSHNWPGALSFKNSKNQMVYQPVRNIRELGRAITQQDDYVQCQVRHFWNWYIGKDILLSPERLSEISKKFVELERRPNHFINYLVQTPEFRRRVVETPVQQTTRRVKEIFKRCDSCHTGKTDDVTGEPLIQLSVWPLGQSQGSPDPSYWLKRITKKIDLENGGRNRSMPPPEINWSLTRDELLLIQKWIQLGAPNESGQMQVTP